jgi:hypothetical protein
VTPGSGPGLTRRHNGVSIKYWNVSPIDDWLNASARKAEREWQRLCDAYLPIRVKGSIWRYSRSRIRGDLSQGWKLHVSATILSACPIFRLIAPYLKRRDIWFKAPKSLAELQKLNSGIFYGFSQIGKPPVRPPPTPRPRPTPLPRN